MSFLLLSIHNKPSEVLVHPKTEVSHKQNDPIGVHFEIL